MELSKMYCQKMVDSTEVETHLFAKFLKEELLRDTEA